MKKIILQAIRFYQLFLSPFAGRHCRFHPSCSSYMAGAIEKHGAAKGVGKGLWRIIRCNPLCCGGVDEP